MVDDYTIDVINNTTIHENELQNYIYKGEIIIQCNEVLENQRFVFDIKSYLNAYQKDIPMFKITNTTLNIDPALIIPDGVYTITININQFSKTDLFINYRQIEKQINALVEDKQYNVIIGTNSTYKTYDNITLGDIEQIRTLLSLFDYLIILADGLDISESVRVFNEINKLLKLIK